jgi:hypothetical protein
MSAKPAWKKGRGKLGPLAPLLGVWRATADSAMGPVQCERAFTAFGDGWVRLEAVWTFGATRPPRPEAAIKATARAYREIALFGVGASGVLGVWSFTNDGKRSEGALADGADIHAQAICFESQMPAGLARQVYWPGDAGAVHWAVEARTKSGWKRFTEHTYRRVG